MERIGQSPDVLSITAASILCLSSVIHHEAQGESFEGQVAVASVVLNRVESHRFPNTVCEVLKQPKQFSWYSKKPLTNKKAKLAEQILKGEVERTVPKAYFFTTLKVRLKRTVLRIIGRHRFYGL